MTIQQLKRVFVYHPKGTLKEKTGAPVDGVIELPDPNPALTPEEVLDHYSSDYPELSNAVVVPDGEKSGRFMYKIESTAGTKG